MSDPVLLEEASPEGNIVATVEQDDRCAYLYLYGTRESGFGMRSCWVRNLLAAPPSLDASAMREGNAPMLPYSACAHRAGAPPLQRERLRFVWLEEGDGVALFEDDEMLAIIPGWSGRDGFHGYARDCTACSTVCWPLTRDNALHERVARADEFWQSWRTGNPWIEVRDAGMAAIEAAVGEHSNYYAIDDGRWPAKALLRVPTREATVLVTIGICIRPQPRVEQLSGELPRRFELGMALDPQIFDRDGDEVIRYVSGQSGLPWQRITWFAPGHTINCKVISSSRADVRFEAVLLVRDPLGAPQVDLPPYRGDRIDLLWMVPITQSERELAISEGGLVLAQRLRYSEVGWVHRDREPVA